MTDKKAFLLRLDPAVWDGLERLARAELRSINAEIEYLLRAALAQRGIDAQQKRFLARHDASSRSV